MVDGPKAIALNRIFELYAEAGASFLGSAKDTDNRIVRKESKEKKAWVNPQRIGIYHVKEAKYSLAI